MSNLRGMAQGTIMFSMDYDDVLPPDHWYSGNYYPYGKDAGKSYYQGEYAEKGSNPPSLAKYLDVPSQVNGVSDANTIFTCSTLQNNFPDRHYAYHVTYSINILAAQKSAYYYSTYKEHDVRANYVTKFSQLPGDMALFLDGYHGVKQGGGKGFYYNRTVSGLWKIGIDDIIASPHSGSTNFVFIDGHAKSIKKLYIAKSAIPYHSWTDTIPKEATIWTGTNGRYMAHNNQ